MALTYFERQKASWGRDVWVVLLLRLWLLMGRGIGTKLCVSTPVLSLASMNSMPLSFMN